MVQECHESRMSSGIHGHLGSGAVANPAPQAISRVSCLKVTIWGKKRRDAGSTDQYPSLDRAERLIPGVTRIGFGIALMDLFQLLLAQRQLFRRITQHHQATDDGSEGYDEDKPGIDRKMVV